MKLVVLPVIVVVFIVILLLVVIEGLTVVLECIVEFLESFATIVSAVKFVV